MGVGVVGAGAGCCIAVGVVRGCCCCIGKAGCCIARGRIGGYVCQADSANHQLISHLNNLS